MRHCSGKRKAVEPGYFSTPVLPHPADQRSGQRPCRAGFECRQGSGVEVSCAEGTFSEAAAPNCTAAAKGHYSDDPAKEMPCPNGTFADVERLGACKPCEPGTFSEAAAASCTPAALGHFSDDPTHQTVCPPGTFAEFEQLTECVLCEAGMYSASAAKNCTPAALGHYSDVVTQQTPCGVGTFADVEGLVECAPCGIGMHADSTGSVVCRLCEDGLYQSQEGRSKCIKCAAGMFRGAAEEGTALAAAAAAAAECTICDGNDPDSDVCPLEGMAAPAFCGYKAEPVITGTSGNVRCQCLSGDSTHQYVSGDLSVLSGGRSPVGVCMTCAGQCSTKFYGYSGAAGVERVTELMDNQTLLANGLTDNQTLRMLRCVRCQCT